MLSFYWSHRELFSARRISFYWYCYVPPIIFVGFFQSFLQFFCTNNWFWFVQTIAICNVQVSQEVGAGLKIILTDQLIQSSFTYLFFFKNNFDLRGRSPSQLWDLQYFTMILQCIRIIVEDARFEFGTANSTVCFANNDLNLS